MISSCCSYKGLFACGIATSHPHAVFAVISALNKSLETDRTISHANRIIKSSNIPYLQNSQLEIFVENSNFTSKIKTDYFVDHTEINSIIKSINDWKLGSLEDGEEFLAIIFL